LLSKHKIDKDAESIYSLVLHSSTLSPEGRGGLGYSDYRKFEQVIDRARIACFNSGHRLDDHFVDITDMVDIGKGGRRNGNHM